MKLKSYDFLLKEIADPYVQENFWRLKRIFEDIEQNGIQGPQGPAGPQGPIGPTPTEVPKLTDTYDTDAGTLAGHLVKVIGTNLVQRITDNLPTTIPNGIFGAVIAKPSPLQAQVIFIGIVGGYAGFTPGLPLYVSSTGTPTHTPPPPGIPATSQQIGFAVSPTSFFLMMMQPFRRS